MIVLLALQAVIIVYYSPSGTSGSDNLNIYSFLSSLVHSDVAVSVSDTLNVELVDRCIKKLHLVETCGPD